jgi:alpha-beta hydrolase superfamily lysophospholipase
MIELHPSEQKLAAPTASTPAAAPTPAVGTPFGPLLGCDRFTASRSRLAAGDGVSLHLRSWLPAGQPASGVLIFVHGIASHGGWFSQTATHLASRGIAVYAPDRRGSGLSGGTRGHAEDVEQLLDDLDRSVRLAEAAHPETPVFLLGSSWGAKLALAYAARHQDRLAGLLLHGPGLFPTVDLNPLRKLTVLACYRLDPERQLQIPLTPASYTRQPEYRAYIEGDPYRLLTASARFYWQTRALDRARNRLVAGLTLPILLQIGEDDPIMNVAASCRWLQSLGAPDRTAITYRNASHTLDFEAEPTVRSYRADLLGWLRRQINRRQTEREDMAVQEASGAR